MFAAFFPMRIYYARMLRFSCLSVMADYRNFSRDFPPRFPVSVFRFAFQKYTLTFFFRFVFCAVGLVLKRKQHFLHAVYHLQLYGFILSYFFSSDLSSIDLSSLLDSLLILPWPLLILSKYLSTQLKTQENIYVFNGGALQRSCTNESVLNLTLVNFSRS